MPQRAATGDCFSKKISVAELDVEQVDGTAHGEGDFRFDPSERGEAIALMVVGWLALHWLPGKV